MGPPGFPATTPGSAEYVLSPAYDLLPVNLLLPEDREEFALTMNGKKTNLRRSDFLRFAEEAGVADTAAKKIVAGVTGAEDAFLALCGLSRLPEDMKDAMKALISARCARLRG